MVRNEITVLLKLTSLMHNLDIILPILTFEDQQIRIYYGSGTVTHSASQWRHTRLAG